MQHATIREEQDTQVASEGELAKERKRIAQRQRQEEEWAKEASATIQQVVLNSCVKFEAGLAIQHVICGLEASRILVKNLTVNTNKADIIRLFTRHGIAQNDVAVLKIETVDGHQQATVLGKAVDIESVALRLDGIKFHDKDLNVVVCERTSEGRTMGTPSRKSYHLSITWRLPRRGDKYTSDEVFNALNTHLRNLNNSTLTSFALSNVQKPGIASAKAIFGSWEGAKSAHDSLNGRTLRYGFPTLRLFLFDPYYFVLALDERQYNAQKSQWTELCSGKTKEVKLQTKTIVDRVSGREKVLVTLSGRDKKIVGAMKVRIESMAAGQKLDATYWHASFKTSKGQEFLGGLFDSTGAFVHCDWRHNSIAVSGTTEAIEAAKTRLREEVERISAEQWIIPLQRRALGYFIREGLAKMRGLLGEENVTLNVEAHQIVLRGANLEEARHYLRQLMDEFANRKISTASLADDVVCQICYDTVSQPVELSCEHMYCSACLRHYVVSTLDNHAFPLKCMGNGATCNKPLSLPLIKKFLPPQRFNELLEAAFVSHIEKNPEMFKYCNTPACSQVYRATTTPQELQCPSCFAEICSACCDDTHTGMTCAERRALKDTGEQERLLEDWASDNDVQRCPSCRVWVEKTEGCNHMSCRCGVHFCWICTRVFDAGQIYGHMSEAHGGYYTNPEPRANRTQNRNQVPDIVQIVGGPAAVAEQMAEFRRIELQREANRGRGNMWAMDFERIGQERVRQWEEEMEAARRREELRRQEYEARRRETEENRGWCMIM